MLKLPKPASAAGNGTANCSKAQEKLGAPSSATCEACAALMFMSCRLVSYISYDFTWLHIHCLSMSLISSLLMSFVAPRVSLPRKAHETNPKSQRIQSGKNKNRFLQQTRAAARLFFLQEVPKGRGAKSAILPT